MGVAGCRRYFQQDRNGGAPWTCKEARNADGSDVCTYTDGSGAVAESVLSARRAAALQEAVDNTMVTHVRVGAFRSRARAPFVLASPEVSIACATEP